MRTISSRCPASSPEATLTPTDVGSSSGSTFTSAATRLTAVTVNCGTPKEFGTVLVESAGCSPTRRPVSSQNCSP